MNIEEVRAIAEKLARALEINKTVCRIDEFIEENRRCIDFIEYSTGFHGDRRSLSVCTKTELDRLYGLAEKEAHSLLLKKTRRINRRARKYHPLNNINHV